MKTAEAIRDLGRKKWIRFGLFPLLLVLLSMLGVFRGVDLSDTTYSLGNYRFFYELHGDWIFATGLANLAGNILLSLSGGSMTVMSVICRFLIAAVALIPYFSLADEETAVPVFVGSWISIGFCWCPAVILYNYLSYVFLIPAALLIKKGNGGKSLRTDAAAGILLGLALFVRISNLVYCMLILYVWIVSICRNNGIKKDFLIRTLSCVCSYIVGAFLGIVVLLACAGGMAGDTGIGEMIAWVSSLAMSRDAAGGYSLREMLITVCRAYLWALVRFLPLAAVAGFGVILRFLPKMNGRKVLRTGLHIASIAFLFVMYYRRGVFTGLYYSNGSVYGIGAVLLVILCVIFCSVLLSGKKSSAEEREWALLGGILLLIAPLGTNNHLYAVLNQLFLILPLGLKLLFRKPEREREEIAKPVHLTISAFLLLLVIQTTGFRACYSFVDGEDGTRLDQRIEAPQELCGMKTSEAHAQSIEALAECAEIRGAETLLTYGNLPGLHYVTGLSPAISTLWPDLESYAADKLSGELSEIGTDRAYPVVILSAEAYKRLDHEENGDVSVQLAEKDRCVSRFLSENGYEIKYRDHEFVLYAR